MDKLHSSQVLRKAWRGDCYSAWLEWSPRDLCREKCGKTLETVETIVSGGGKAVAMECDVTDREAVEKLFASVEEKFEKLDILVNNAGITRDTLMPVMRDDQWDEIIAANLTSCFLFCRAASKLMMRKRYGRIINMSSVSGIIGNAGQTNYSATKAGMIGSLVRYPRNSLSAR